MHKVGEGVGDLGGGGEGNEHPFPTTIGIMRWIIADCPLFTPGFR